ncbi:MAG: histidine phosphatase family protein [Haloarculaceae archaeon]
MVRLLAVRHGETDWNRTGRLQGWAPIGLNDSGRAQARALAEDLEDLEGIASVGHVDRLVTSDLRRTRETASVLREALDLPTPQAERAFRERHLGVYQGLPVDAVRERHPELDDIGAVTGLQVTPESGESLADVADRVRQGVTMLRTEAEPDETVVLVTHGPIRILVAEATGRDLLATIRDIHPRNCEAFAFDIGGDITFEGKSRARR